MLKNSTIKCRANERVRSKVALNGDAGTDGTKSPVAGKNDMGGEASNIAQGGEETGGKSTGSKRRFSW